MFLNAQPKKMNDTAPQCPPDCCLGLNADHAHPLDDAGTILAMCLECGAIVALAPVTTRDGSRIYTSAAEYCRQCPAEGSMIELSRSQSEAVLRLRNALAYFRDPNAKYSEYDPRESLNTSTLMADTGGRVIASMRPESAA
jgi:hypothetical protein